MPLQATSGAASYDAFGGGVPAVPNYIEDVFSTWLYTGNGSTQTITNGIDLAGKGGLVWIKRRDSAFWHNLYDTVRGPTNALYTNNTSAQAANPAGDFLFNSSGFSLNTTDGNTNEPGSPFASWTFREQPKFFDIVTYTGDDASNRQIPHNLGSVPGCFIIKRTDTSGFGWVVYHQSLGNTQSISLQTTGAAYTTSIFNNTSPTATNFTVNAFDAANRAGGTYVAYLFAHNAGGFGLTGTDNVISCGSFTTDGSGNATINLGYEAQWATFKASSTTGNWFMLNNMAGWSNVGTDGSAQRLYANTSGAEATDGVGFPTATGFVARALVANATYIYIAIRRGPMRTPTTGTSVFAPVAYAGNNLDNRLVDAGVLTDMTMARARSRTSAGGFYTADRLRGDEFLRTAGSDAALTDSDTFMTPTVGVGNSFSAMSGFGVGNDTTYRVNTESDQLAYALRRAPGFFDEVCYTGTGSARTVEHNLGVVPEMMIVKARTTGSGGGPFNWTVYHTALSAGGFAYLNLDNAGVFSGNTSFWNGTAPTASVFSLGGSSGLNGLGNACVAYLFASCPGVSKVGSYTGNGDPVGTTGAGVTQDINCGFTGGARFVLIKRTNAADNWYVWDTARGITSTTEPDLSLNTTAAESSGFNSVNPLSSGFTVRQNAGTNVNAAGQTYIYLAIA